MSRPRTGTISYRRNIATGLRCWHARYTRGDRTRTNWIPLDPKILENDRAAALTCAAQFASTAKATTKNGTGQTVSAYSTRWLAQRPKGTATDNASHLTHHVLPIIGDVSILQLASSHGDELVAYLDAKIAAGKMSDKHARNIWGTVGRMLRDAAHAKPATGLRCLDANPFKDVQPPEKSKTKKSKQFLYPSEFLALVSCPEVPVRWKENAAIAVYLKLRDGEQRALRWAHVDLEHGIVNVCETTSKGKAREGTKSGKARPVQIPATLMPLLEAMHAAVDGAGLVCTGIASQRAMARGLRTWLKKAGVTRAALFDNTPVNLNIRWHDLRATGGTWMAVEGRTAVEIRDELGHSATAMTDRYLRPASEVRSGTFGEPFPALPAFRQRSVMTKNALAKYSEANEFLRGGRDSKSHTTIPEVAIYKADRDNDADSQSSRLAPIGRPSGVFAGGELTELASLESRMVDAELAGRKTVADALARRIEALKSARLPSNVVPIRKST